MMSRSVAVTVALLAAWSTSAGADDARTGSTPPNPDFVAKFGDKAMGTIVNLTIWTDDEIKAAEAAKAVFAEFRRIALADPQLPPALLPPDWIGDNARSLAAEIYASVAESSERFLIATADPPLSPVAVPSSRFSVKPV